MWTPMEPWQVAQLERLSSIDHDKVESALNDLWDAHPEMLEQITISAIDQEQITLDRGAQILRMSEADVEQKLAEFQRRALKRCCVVVCEGSVAKLADGGLPVWEVVRVFRKLGTFEKLQEAFSGVSLQTLESALAYAELNGAEIEQQIARYEELLERRRAEYPYVR
jgi:predicted HTH domain antitoxin/uncharacterized protein (DUF433 family)